MDNIVRTVYGSYLQSIMLNKGQKFTLLPNTTLNEKFGIQSGVVPPENDIPRLGYYVIGLGGHSYTVGADSIPLNRALQHKATNAALYKHLPFVLRLTTDDLNESQRAKYALRKTIMVDGVQYYAYYAKRLAVDNLETNLEYRIVENNTTTISEFTPTSDNLNPIPPAISTNGVNTVMGDFVASSTKISLSMTAEEVAEVINAAKIIYDDENYAIASELALVTGVDKIVSTNSSSGSINFMEVIAAQCFTFFNTKIEFTATRNGYSTVLDVGSTEPLFNIGN